MSSADTEWALPEGDEDVADADADVVAACATASAAASVPAAAAVSLACRERTTSAAVGAESSWISTDLIVPSLDSSASTASATLSLE
jgi:hypothetical protein